MKREAKKIEWAGVEDMPPLAVSLSSMRVNKTGTWRQMRPVIDYGKCKNCGILWNMLEVLSRARYCDRK